MTQFGDLLKHYRKRCSDARTGKKLTQRRLADLLSKEPHIGAVTDATISNWERGVYPIDHADRAILIGLLKIFHQYCGVANLSEANALLQTGGYRDLDQNEASHIAAQWTIAAPPPQPAMTPAPPPRLKSDTPPPRMTPAYDGQRIVGRADDLDKIFDLLRLSDPIPDLPPAALYGMAGVGKTTLAIALGRDNRVTQHFPDGVLWISVGPKPTLRNLLDQWGNALGLNLLSARDEAACQNRLRGFLFERRALLIVDDVWDAQQGKTFQVGGPHCRILYTTRESPIAYELATMPRALSVKVLAPDAALDILRRLAPLVVAENEPRARELCERLGYLPLALTLAGNLLAIETDVPARLERLTRELIERGDARLALARAEPRAGIEAESVSVRAILDLSVQRLSATDQDRFAKLGAFDGEPATFDLRAAAYVWELLDGDAVAEQATATMAQLVQRGLVNRRGARYEMHALLADYAVALQKERGL